MCSTFGLEVEGMTARLTVLLDDDVEARFAAFCNERGHKKSTLVARLIQNHLEGEERDASRGKSPNVQNSEKKS